MLNQDSSVSLEYAISVLTWLESFTGKHLQDQETKLWTERLQKYPKWKLLKLDEYTGPLNNSVFKYLDELQMPVEKFKALPLPEPSSRQKQMAADFFAYIKELFSYNWVADRADCEMRYVKMMKEKFNVNVTPGMMANRNKSDLKMAAANDV